MGKFVPLMIGILLAAFGIAALATAGARSREASREREQKLAADREAADLRERLRRLEAQPKEAPPPSKVEPVAESAEMAALKKEVEVLRSALEAALAKLAEFQTQAPRPPVRPKVEDAAALQARALDTTKTAAERIEALSKLRSLTGGRTAAVAIAMLDLLESGVEPRARANILSLLKGAVPEDQANRVIAFLKADPERDVRQEAAEALGPLKHLDLAKSALEEASKTDASEPVRREAKRALERD